MNISQDSYAMILLCSDLALRKSHNSIKPYTVVQWSKLAQKLLDRDMRPSVLFDISSSSIKNELGLDEVEIERIERLLSFSGELGIELSSLNDQGIFPLTRADKEYPMALRKKLKKKSPPVLFYAGNLSLLNNNGICIVGSRNIDQAGIDFTEILSRRCTNDGLNIVSGGARGVDSIAENIANSSEGTTIIVLADSMSKKIRKKDTRDALLRKQSIILSTSRPDMHFQTYAAMDRNKYVYALSDFAVVISSDYNKGGTWAGATENLKNSWVPLFVRESEEIPEGNKKLLNYNQVHPITEDVLNGDLNMFDWFKNQSYQNEIVEEPQQMSIFEIY